MNEKINIRLAIAATILTAVIFLFLFLYIGFNNRKYAYEDSKRLASEVSRKAVLETEIYIDNAISIARVLREKAILLRRANVDRSFIIEMIKDALVNNPNFLAVWTMWEHNAYDNKDEYYKNLEGHDLIGNISTTYFKYKDSILIEQTQPDDYLEDYYAIPKKTRSEYFIDPYYYQYNGFPYVFYEISIVVPVIIDTTFCGVFGIDLSLDGLLSILRPVKLYETGYLCLIANSGTIVSHMDAAYIKKNIFEIIPSSEILIYEAIKSGKELSIETTSEFTGKKVFRYFYPISSSDNKNPWSMMVEIPIEEATTRSEQLLFVAFGILFLGLSLLLYLVFNIFERRKYERKIIEAKTKAEESDRLKTAFLNNISHEIRTPLNGILGFSELLTGENLNNEQTKLYKEIIHASANQLLSVITNVIELSKIQSSQIEKIVKEFEIEKTIQRVVETYAPSLKEKGLRLVLNFPESGQLIKILSDESKFKQILSYLLDNAIKFTEKGFVEIGYFNQGNSYLFYVMDSGVGIKPENYINIFKYFNQEDASLNRNFGGLGVGLSISKSYVDLLGGSIRFESEVGIGTTFYFTLPNLQLKLNDLKTLHEEISDRAKLTILIVEDQKNNYILLNEILTHSGIKTIYATNGEEAVRLCRENNDIGLIFMDIKMPVMNGFEAAKLLNLLRRIFRL